MKFAYPAVLAACLILGACGAKDASQSSSQSGMEKFLGVSAASLEVTTLDGEKQPLNDPLSLNGKPVILNVWATWCPPCLLEMPTLDALGKSGKYTVIAIATDKDAKTVKDFLKNQTWGTGLTVWFDSLGAVTRQKLGTTGLPTTFVLDKDLTIHEVEVGDRVWNSPAMEKKIAAALKSR